MSRGEIKTGLDGSTVTIAGTTYTLTVAKGIGEKYGDNQWAWVCSCKRTGRWTGQSDHAAAFGWIRHLGKWHGLVRGDSIRLHDAFMEAIR